MKSSINSSCCSQAPIMSAKETGPGKRRQTAEENTGKETKGAEADAQMMNNQLPFSEPSSAAGKDRSEIVEVVGGPDCLLRFEHCYLYGYSYAGPLNEDVFGSLAQRTQTIDLVMGALADPNTHIMGICSSNENAISVTASSLESVIRRAKRDSMFDVILKATVTKKPNIKKIQDEIARGLDLKLDEKSKEKKRASILHDHIKMKQKILVILFELHKGIDLVKVGIPFGAHHAGCKILLTSTSEEVLSNQMHTQTNVKV